MILPFLTAMDPSDLPSTSIDPLGFERGYLWIADQILPGLTNVADRPRYYGVLCAGAALGTEGTSSRTRYESRLEAILRLERLWALACCLASFDNDALSLGSLRGVTRASQKAQALIDAGEARTNGSYTLLSRQVTYGGVGIYGAIAERLGLWDRGDLAVTPALGAELALAFRTETDMPDDVAKVCLGEKTQVTLDNLRVWGRGAHVSAPLSQPERRLLRQAAFRDGVRSHMLGLLVDNPPEDHESELGRMARLAEGRGVEAHHRAALRLAVAYEGVYRVLLFVFERLLDHARNAPSGVVDGATLRADPALDAGLARAITAIHDLDVAATDLPSTPLSTGIRRLDDIRALGAQCRSAANPVELVDMLTQRHRDVQSGKWDRGRPKAPWIDQRPDGWTLALRGAGGRAPQSPDDVAPHPYRFGAAGRLAELA